MRPLTFSIARSFFIAILTMMMCHQDAAAQASNAKDTPKAAATASASTELTNKAELALKQMVSFDFDDTSFSDVKAELEKLTGLNFILTSSASDDALTPDETFTFKIKDVPLWKSLELMLQEKNATYVIDSGVVSLISLDEASDEKWMRVKMFDCREFVNVLPKTAPPVQLFSRGENWGSFTGGGGGFAWGFGGGGFGGSGGGSGFLRNQTQMPTAKPVRKKQALEKTPSPESKLLDAKLEKIMSLMEDEATRRQLEPSSDQTLTELVRTIVQPGNWHGGNGKIESVNGILIVQHSENILRKIEGFLEDLKGKLLTTPNNMPLAPEPK